MIIQLPRNKIIIIDIYNRLLLWPSQALTISSSQTKEYCLLVALEKALSKIK